MLDLTGNSPCILRTEKESGVSILPSCKGFHAGVTPAKAPKGLLAAKVPAGNPILWCLPLRLILHLRGKRHWQFIQLLQQTDSVLLFMNIQSNSTLPATVPQVIAENVCQWVICSYVKLYTLTIHFGFMGEHVSYVIRSNFSLIHSEASAYSGYTSWLNLLFVGVCKSAEINVRWATALILVTKKLFSE